MIVYTIGHSNRTIESFIAMLQSFSIKLLADVRTMPGSTWSPHFSRTALERSLQQAGIKYLHMPGLGGKNKIGYPAYRSTIPFQNAIQQLERLAAVEPLAYMCAEAQWQQCHRSHISDHLKAKGWTVMHIEGNGIASAHKFTPPPLPKQGDLFYV